MYLITIVMTLGAGLAPGFEELAAERTTGEDTHEGPFEQLVAEDTDLSKAILELVREKFAEHFDEPELTPEDITEEPRRRPEDNRRRGLWDELAAYFNKVPVVLPYDPNFVTLFLTGARGGEHITICDWSCNSPGSVLGSFLLTRQEKSIVLPRTLALDIVFHNGGQGNGQAVQLRMFEDFDLIASGSPDNRECYGSGGIRGADPFIPVTAEAKCAYWHQDRSRQRNPTWPEATFTHIYNFCMSHPPSGHPDDWATQIFRLWDSDFLVNTFSCGDMVEAGSNQVGLYHYG